MIVNLIIIIMILITGPVLVIGQLSSASIPYPSVFVGINTVDRGKTRNEAHRRDHKKRSCNTFLQNVAVSSG